MAKPKVLVYALNGADCENLVRDLSLLAGLEPPECECIALDSRTALSRRPDADAYALVVMSYEMNIGNDLLNSRVNWLRKNFPRARICLRGHHDLRTEAMIIADGGVQFVSILNPQRLSGIAREASGLSAERPSA